MSFADLRITRFAAAGLAGLALAPSARAQCGTDELTPIGGQNGSIFGQAIGASEDRLLVSQIAFNQFGTNRLYDYERTPSGWVFAGEIPNPDPATTFLFGWSLDVAGDVALVGDPNGAGLAGGEGAAFVYERTPSGWGLRERLFASDGQFEDQFGIVVDLDPAGNRAIVGAREMFPGDPSAPAGKVYVFERGPSGWSQVARFDPATPASSFGTDVAIDGDLAVASAPDEPTGASGSGAVYVYERGPSGWASAARLTSPGGAGEYLAYGASLAIARETVLIGATHESSPGTFATGAVRVYDRGSTGWSETSVLRASAGAGGMRFGAGIAAAPDVVVVSSAYTLAPPGGPHVFERFGTGWSERGQLIEAAGQLYVGQEDTQPTIAGTACAYSGFGVGQQRVVRLFDLESVATSDVPSISVSAGGVQTLEVRTGCPPRAGLPYIVLGSASGTSTALPVPLVVDLYFFHTLQAPNSAFLADTFGTLDAAGRATARFVLPQGLLPAAVGLELDHAFVGIELLPGLLQLTAISNPVHLSLVP